jgi:site-specific recombinase XerD
MITIWRRHTDTCPHREKGRDYLKCNCPLHADGYINGERTLRVSLRTNDLAKARKRAVDKLAELESPDAIVCKPLDEAVAAYLRSCEALCENVQRKYRNRLEKQLLPFCQQAGIDSVSEIKLETLDNYHAQRRSARDGKRLAGTTWTKERETLVQFFAFCEDRQWIKGNPAKKIKPPKERPPEIEPYTAEEVARILEAAGKIGKSDYERLRARAAVLLLRHTALRISDVALLSRDRIYNGELFLHTKKTGGIVRLPLPDELLAALEAVPTPRGADPERSTHFFINGAGSGRTAISVMERCLRSVFKLSGVKDGHAHRFRHTLATEILANGGTLADVADILGISESVAREHYAKWSQDRQKRIEALMRVMNSGTNWARKKKLVVIA